MDATRHVFGQAQIDRARSLREAARLTCEQAHHVRTCFTSPVAPNARGGVDRTVARVDLPADGHE